MKTLELCLCLRVQEQKQCVPVATRDDGQRRMERLLSLKVLLQNDSL